MKKLLLGTSALTSAMMLSAAAHAAEPMALTISGYFEGVVVAGDDDIKGNRGLAFDSWNTELHFDAKGVTDGGLTYGFHIELEGITTGDQIDESFLYLSGGFGQLEFGSTDSVGGKMSYLAPQPEPSGIINLNSPDYFPAARRGLGTVTTIIGQTSAFGAADAVKVNYFTPRIAGFQLGVTFSPDSCEDAGCTLGGNFAAKPPGGAGAPNRDYEAALNFEREFGAISLAASAAYSRVTQRGGPDEDGYAAGLNVGFGMGSGSVTVGGSYLAYRDMGLIKNADYDAFDLGARYATGPWTAGVSYINGDTNGAGGGLTTWGLALGAGYALAPGLALAGGYEHYDRSTDGVGNDQSANIFLLGTELSF